MSATITPVDNTYIFFYCFTDQMRRGAVNISQVYPAITAPTYVGYEWITMAGLLPWQRHSGVNAVGYALNRNIVLGRVMAPL